MKKNILKKSKHIILSGAMLCLMLVTFLSLTAFASTTLMTYNGTGIRSKASIQSFKLSSPKTVTVHHTTSKWSSNDPGCYLKVALQKKGIITYSDVAKNYFYGVTSGSFSNHSQAGTYRLYFTAYTNTGSAVSGATIKGSVTG